MEQIMSMAAFVVLELVGLALLVRYAMQWLDGGLDLVDGATIVGLTTTLLVTVLVFADSLHTGDATQLPTTLMALAAMIAGAVIVMQRTWKG